jgi:hypothetical protein
MQEITTIKENRATDNVLVAWGTAAEQAAGQGYIGWDIGNLRHAYQKGYGQRYTKLGLSIQQVKI